MHAFVIQRTEIVSGPDTLIIQTENTIGIEEVRQVQAFLAKKPIQEKNNSVYVYNAHLLTIPAQNALLKTLEEPPGNAQIFLITSQPDLLLPTVLSRVQIVDEKSDVRQIDTSETKKIIEEIMSANAGQKLALVDKLNFDREKALEFLDKLEHLLHQDLNLKINYEAIVQARKYLKANVNVKLVLDKLVLSVI